MDEGKCALCGTPSSPGAQYCAACGEALRHQKQATAQRQLKVLGFQGVSIRFVAQLVDVIILGIIMWVLSFTGAGTVTFDASTGQISTSPFLGLLVLIDLLIAFLYFTILEGRIGQTVGKMLLKIKVVKQATGASISYGDAAVRTILRIIDLIPFFVPYLLAAVLIWSSENKQRLGDRVAHTVVVQY
ncbi:MAG TPA: RDD family protein [Candidatus Bathyarchaeia archaeon]|nr:RDD family protein [Candidatus Bathyarchaeia archaeon]